MALEVVYLDTFEEIKAKESILSGSIVTIHLQECKKQLEREGYSGRMYYCLTKNMRFAEDQLLELQTPKYNKNTRSSAESGCMGSVYVIEGIKR